MFGRARANPSSPRAILLDAMGTLVRFEPPAPRLADGLGVSLQDAERAIRAEIGYYRAHLHLGSDADGLAAVRLRCAEVVRRTLGLDASAHAVLPVLLDSIRFVPYPETVGALRALRAAGCVLVVVSNWDVSLHEVLERTGLRDLIDGAVASAEIGSAKPDGAIFAHGLALAGGLAPDAALHVGDSPLEDVEGARRAGIAAVLVDRDGAHEAVRARRIASLADLPRLAG